MESMLEGFQLHLGNISSEIHALQQQSMQMNIKLKNRQVSLNSLLTYFTVSGLSPLSCKSPLC